MGHCELCGKETNVSKTLLEGTVIDACGKCGKYGKVVSKPPVDRVKRNVREIKEVKEPTEIVVTNYASLIKKAREKRGLNQKEFAKEIKEKASIVHKLETGSFEPSIELAQRLGKMLNINLIETVTETKVEQKRVSGAGLTIGDMLKKK